jgi:phosphatidylserine/phosphatidylglycerophosphate/cardiolipin synthase-like enzyme
MDDFSLSSIVTELVDDLPDEHVRHIASLLDKELALNWDRLVHLMKSSIPQIDAQKCVRLFVEKWKALPVPPTPHEMALLLSTVNYAMDCQREKEKVELIWTGPKSHNFNLRRTDQALVELINSAQQQIILVSFAVYKAKNIMSALEKASDRGVEIKIVLESPDDSEGKIAYNTIRALGPALRSKARIFIWPFAKRPSTPDGKYGALHAKIAIADARRLYVSSANLTDYAMNLNMEMGVLLENSELSLRSVQLFEDLISDKTLAEIARE